MILNVFRKKGALVALIALGSAVEREYGSPPPAFVYVSISSIGRKSLFWKWYKLYEII